jgi:hypothetical protein
VIRPVVGCLLVMLICPPANATTSECLTKEHAIASYGRQAKHQGKCWHGPNRRERHRTDKASKPSPGPRPTPPHGHDDAYGTDVAPLSVQEHVVHSETIVPTIPSRFPRSDWTIPEEPKPVRADFNVKSIISLSFAILLGIIACVQWSRMKLSPFFYSFRSLSIPFKR